MMSSILLLGEDTDALKLQRWVLGLNQFLSNTRGVINNVVFCETFINTCARHCAFEQ